MDNSMENSTMDWGAEHEPVSEEPTIFDREFTLAGDFFPEQAWRLGEWQSKVPIVLRTGEGFSGRWFRLAESWEGPTPEMLWPSDSKDTILQRQSTLLAIIEQGDIPEIAHQIDESKKLSQGLRKLFEPLDIEGRRYEPPSSLYEEHSKGESVLMAAPVMEDVMLDAPKKVEIDVHDAVAGCVEQIQHGAESIKELAELLAQISDPHIQETVTTLQDIASSAQQLLSGDRIMRQEEAPSFKFPVVRKYQRLHARYGQIGQFSSLLVGRMPGYADTSSIEEYKPRYRPHPVDSKEAAWASSLEDRLEEIEGVISVAEMVERRGWQPVTFNNEQPEGYVAGRHLKRSTGHERPNDAVADTPITVLGAANGSGKTYYMESDFYIHTAAQSIGFAPVEQGNLRIYDSFAFLGRTSSHGSRANNRGAFIHEMDIWQITLLEMGDRPLIYLDEGASTTSPEEQAALLTAFSSLVTEQGGRAMLATHNEIAADMIGAMEAGSVYHFSSDIDPETGKLVSTHELAEGADDSKFIAMARAMQLPSRMNQTMQRYIAGELGSLPEPRTAELPKIEVYTSQERRSLMQAGGGVAYMFPEKADNPLFAAFSEDKNLLSYGLGALVDQLVLHSSPLSSKELLERQKTFEALSNYEQLEQLAECVNDVFSIEPRIALIEQKTKSGLLEALNPVRDKAATWQFGQSDSKEQEVPVLPQKALAYLQILEQAMGSAFTWEDEMQELQSSLQEYERVRTHQKPKGTLRYDEELQNEYLDAQERFYSIQHRAGAILTGVEEALEENQPPMIDYTQLVDLHVREALDVLASSDRQLNGEKSGGKDHSPDYGNRHEMYGAFASADYLAFALNSIEPSRESLKWMGERIAQIDSVHVRQAHSHIVKLFNRELDKLQPKQGTEQEAHRQIQRARSSLSRDVGGVFESQLSPLTRQESPEDIELKRLVRELVQGTNTPLQDEAKRFSALLQVAQVIRDQNFNKVQFQDTGEVVMKDVVMFSPHDGDHMPNSLELDSQTEQAMMFASPHGSGKTFYQKSIAKAAIFAQMIGYAPASEASMSLLDRVIYVDRVAQSMQSELSAGMQEIQYWKEVSALAQTPGKALVAVDEAGSSTSPKYQGAFTAAIAQEILNAGHLLVMASHNHASTAAIEGIANGRVGLYHFADTQDEKAQASRKHQLTRGFRGSFAIESARKSRLPSEFIDSAARYLDTIQ